MPESNSAGNDNWSEEEIVETDDVRSNAISSTQWLTDLASCFRTCVLEIHHQVLQRLTRPTQRGFASMVAGILLGGLGFVTTAPAAAAQVFPTKNIMLVIPFPAGGRSDITIRLLAPYLEKELGQPLVILNKPGGGSSIG